VGAVSRTQDSGSQRQEGDVHQAERGRHQTGRRFAQVRREGSDHRPEGDAGGRGRGEPAQRFGPFPGRHRIGHIGLSDAGGAAARALDQPGKEKKPETLREPEDDVRERRSGEPDEEGGPTAVAIRHPAPERRGDQLGDRERRDQETDDLGGCVKIERVEGQQREHDHETDHVHEVDRDEDRQPAEAATAVRRRHPVFPPRPCPPDTSAKTTALTSISTTPYAAATPTSACRRLDRISREIGRVS
jgi:hypothetical protein